LRINIKKEMKTAQKLAIALLKLKLQVSSSISLKWGARVAFGIFSTPFRRPRSVPPPIFTEADEFNIIVNDLAIAGYRWNHQSPKKILILHGFESRAYNFYRYVNPLLEKGFGVYAMDAKAHGKSQGKTIIVPEYTSMIEVLERTYGRFDGFVSHSFGGIALSLFQEKHNNPEAKLVLIAPATETSSAVARFCKFFSLGNNLKEAIFKLIENKSGNKVSFYSIKRIAPLLPNPILWIHDKDDDITPLDDVKPIIETNLPNIEFMITSGMGHRKIYKDNQVVKKVVDFIS
jgi:pimeloyl-ACP methyl ester carboxylesterase